MWEISYSPAAQKDLEKLSPEIRQEIINKIKFFSDTKNIFAFAKRIKNVAPPTYRFRVRKWRIRFIIKDGAISVTRIRLRDKAY